jgi:HTH-type transcriptional regulator/antitoxin HipB
LGGAIRQARADRGWTQVELAERAHVSRRWLAAVEAGETPGVEFSRLAATLSVLGLRFEVAPEPPPSAAEAAVIAALEADGDL